MTAHQPPLEYYNAPPPSHRRTAGVTAVAIIGLVISVLFALAIGLGPRQERFRRPSYGNGYGRSYADPPELGVAVGGLVVVTLHVLMAVACCGVLALKSSARALMIVCCFAWTILGALTALYLLYVLFKRFGESGRAPTPMLVSLAVTVGVYLVFPIVALATIWGPRRRAPFRSDRWEPPVSPLVRIVTIITGVCAAFGLSRSLIQVYLLLDDSSAHASWSQRHVYARVLPLYFTNPTTEDSLDLAAAVLLDASLLVGAVLLLFRQRLGRTLIVLPALAQLILAVAFWQGGFRWSDFDMSWNGSPGSNEGLLKLSALTDLFASHAREILAPTLLIAVFTFRGFAAADEPSRSPSRRPY